MCIRDRARGGRRDLGAIGDRIAGADVDRAAHPARNRSDAALAIVVAVVGCGLICARGTGRVRIAGGRATIAHLAVHHRIPTIAAHPIGDRKPPIPVVGALDPAARIACAERDAHRHARATAATVELLLSLIHI